MTTVPPTIPKVEATIELPFRGTFVCDDFSGSGFLKSSRGGDGRYPYAERNNPAARFVIDPTVIWQPQVTKREDDDYAEAIRQQVELVDFQYKVVEL